MIQQYIQCNYLKHPNVFKSGVYGHTKSNKGYWICLDMIKEHTRSQKYKGWTSAYSVISILLQLQSFLIGDKVEQDSGRIVLLKDYLTKDSMQQIVDESNKFKCNRCCFDGINGGNQKIQISPKNKQQSDPNKDDDMKFSDDANYWKLLYADTENIILSYLSYKDCVYFNCVCMQFRDIIERNKIFELQRFGCWYHRIDLNYSQKVLDQIEINDDNDDFKACGINVNSGSNPENFEDTQVLKNMVLGYGITPIFYPSLSKTPYFSDYLHDITLDDHKEMDNANLKFIRLKDCEVTFDLLSYNAFDKHKIRRTVWKEKSFTHFLPIYINGKHAAKSMKLFEKKCLNIFQKEARSYYNKFVPRQYHPMMGIHLIMTAMSSLVVSVTHNIDRINNNKPSLYYSINVIETYIHLYHLLLAVYNRYQDIVSPIINQKCTNFIINPKFRTKKYIPNFGTFRLFFALQNYNWDTIKEPFISEVFIRKIKWLVKSYPLLKTVKDNENKDYRINSTWKQSQKRGFMFQYFFLNYCCKIGELTPSDKFNELNENFGCPEKSLPIKFQKFVKKIYSVKSIYEFFNVVGMENVGKEFVYNMLANACKKSLENGYHKLYNRW